jgi:shikimate kinase
MYNKFERWIENILNQELSTDIIAINFNLYEEENDVWSLELVGTASFDTDDDDWACDETFDTRETPLRWEEKATWEDILVHISSIIIKYLEKGQYAEKLKTYQGVGIGFVDGDIKLLYKR